jgi:hypothetical protein
MGTWEQSQKTMGNKQTCKLAWKTREHSEIFVGTKGKFPRREQRENFQEGNEGKISKGTQTPPGRLSILSFGNSLRKNI